MTTLERMLHIAPIHLYLRGAVYFCDWTVDHGKSYHARGTGSNPGAATYGAWRDALRNRWVKE